MFSRNEERGEGVQEAQEQLSFADDARERFDAARMAYSEARELGFSRTRSAFEAAREALLFGVKPESEKQTIEHHLIREKPEPLRGIARSKREQRQSQKQERETSSPRQREPAREVSVWDALDGIGREQPPPHGQAGANDAMKRIPERTIEQQQEREREAAEVERQKMEREKVEQERDRGLDLGYGL